MKRVFCIALLAAGLATPVAAQQPFNWTGYYVGVNAGYAWADGSARVFESDTGTTVSRSFDLDSFFAGIQGGFNYQAVDSNVVWGVEVDLQWADGDDRVSVTYSNGTGVFTGHFDWFGTLRGRVGVTNGPALWYVTAGGAWPGARFSVFIPFDVTQGAFSGKPKFGWVVGAGVEWLLRDNWTVKFEYQYLDFGARTVNAVGTGGEPLSGRFDLDAHTLRFGFNYRFASGGPRP